MSFISCGAASFHDIDGRVITSFNSDSNAVRASASVVQVTVAATGVGAGASFSGEGASFTAGAARTGEVTTGEDWMVAMKGELPMACGVKEGVSGTRRQSR